MTMSKDLRGLMVAGGGLCATPCAIHFPWVP